MQDEKKQKKQAFTNLLITNPLFIPDQPIIVRRKQPDKQSIPIQPEVFSHTNIQKKPVSKEDKNKKYIEEYIQKQEKQNKKHKQALQDIQESPVKLTPKQEEQFKQNLKARDDFKEKKSHIPQIDKTGQVTFKDTSINQDDITSYQLFQSMSDEERKEQYESMRRNPDVYAPMLKRIKTMNTADFYQNQIPSVLRITDTIGRNLVKGATFGISDIILREITDEDLQAGIKQGENKTLSFVSDFAGGLLTGQAILKKLKHLKNLKYLDKLNKSGKYKNFALKTMALRGLMGATTSGGRNLVQYLDNKIELKDALKNTGISILATGVGIIPEQYITAENLKGKIVNLIGQVGTDVGFEVLVDIVNGDFQKKEGYWKEKFTNSIPSALFGLVDFFNPNFHLEQKAFKQGIKDIKTNGKNIVDNQIKLIQESLDQMKNKYQESMVVGIVPKSLQKKKLKKSGKIEKKSQKNLYNSIYKHLAGEGPLTSRKRFIKRNLTAQHIERIADNPDIPRLDKVAQIRRTLTDSQTGLLSAEGFDLLNLKYKPHAMMDINSAQAIDKLSTQGMEKVIADTGKMIKQIAEKNNKIADRIGGEEFGIINGTKQDITEVNGILKKKRYKIINISPQKLERWKETYTKIKTDKQNKIKQAGGKAEGELFNYKIKKQPDGKYTVVLSNITLSGGTGDNILKANYLVQKAKQKGLSGGILDRKDLDTKLKQEYIKIKGGEQNETSRIFERLGKRKAFETIESRSERYYSDRLRKQDLSSDKSKREKGKGGFSIPKTRGLERTLQRLKTFSYLEKADPDKWKDIQSESDPEQKFNSAMRQYLDDRTSNTFLKSDVYYNNKYYNNPQLKLNNPNVGIINKIFGDETGNDLIKQYSIEIKKIIFSELKTKGLLQQDIDLLCYRLAGGGNYSIINLNKYLSNTEIKELKQKLQDTIDNIQIFGPKIDNINFADQNRLKQLGINYHPTKDEKRTRILNFSHEVEWLTKGINEKYEIKKLKQNLKPIEQIEYKDYSNIEKDIVLKAKVPADLIPVFRTIIEQKGSLPKDINIKSEAYQFVKSYEEMVKNQQKAKNYIEKYIPEDSIKLFNKDVKNNYDDPMKMFNTFKQKLFPLTKALSIKDDVYNEEYYIPYKQKQFAIDWISNKQLQEYRADMTARQLQNETAKISKGRYIGIWERKNNEVYQSDIAVQLLLDVGGKENLKAEYENYKEYLKPLHKKLIYKALNTGPEFDRLIKMYKRMYKELGYYGKQAGVLKIGREFYTARYWKDKAKQDSYPGGFNRSSKHARQRVYKSILEGWANGEDLQIKGASNSIRYYMQDIFNVAQDLAFVKIGAGLIVDDKGNRLFMTQKPDDTYRLINHPGFKKWEHFGKVGKIKDKNGNILLESQLKSRDFIVLGNGTVLKAKQVYAPKDVAGYINNILNRSHLGDIKGLNYVFKLNDKIKQRILTTSMFHYRALTQSYLLGAKTGLKNLNPIKAFSMGLKMVESLDPVVQIAVKNGLTLGYNPEINEKLYGIHYRSRLKDKWNELLFNRYAPGLKVMAFKFEFERQLKIHQKRIDTQIKNIGLEAKEYDITKVPELINQIAEKSANLINDDFGGLNLLRMGRNKDFQKLFRFTALAPDWSESNIRSMVKAVPFRKNKVTGRWEFNGQDAEPYIKFWNRIFVKGLITANLINYAINGRSTFTNEDQDKNFDIDITRLVDPDGKTAKKYYFSILGHFRDPLKAIYNPVKFIRNKASFILGQVIDNLTGHDYAKRPFSSTEELLKTKRFVKKSPYIEPEKGFWGTLPSRTASYILSSQSIQVQNLIGWINGQVNGAEALSRSSGVPIETRWIPPNTAENLRKNIRKVILDKTLSPSERRQKINSLKSKYKHIQREKLLMR